LAVAADSIETIRWFELRSPLGLGLGQWMLVKRGDGKVYTGVIVSMDSETIILGSGNQRQVLQLHNYRHTAALIGGPPNWSPKLADRRLV